MITMKSEREFGKMAVAGRCVGSVLDTVRASAAPGVSLIDLDQMAAEVIAPARVHSLLSPLSAFPPAGARIPAISASRSTR